VEKIMTLLQPVALGWYPTDYFRTFEENCKIGPPPEGEEHLPQASNIQGSPLERRRKCNAGQQNTAYS
jgi:hypothetical protein